MRYFSVIFLTPTASTLLHVPWWGTIGIIGGYLVCTRIDDYLLQQARSSFVYDEIDSWAEDPTDPVWEKRDRKSFDRRRRLPENERILLTRIAEVVAKMP